MAKKTVLIIDDDARNIFALKAMLLAKKFDCVAKTGALEALELLRSDLQVDFILMDMMMPEMDGYEAIPLIKKLENRKSTPVYAVTAQAMLGDKEKCLSAGADAYISKPIDVDRLLQLLV
ncbi:response regulator [Dyadobacter sp. 32]|uniref:response regulator n=1 Tax=Dyadobacter sp. 32 TaxID=538966 RepID=UPI0011ED795E